ncbi:ATP-binding protein [Nonomuraea recticatena]
MATSVSVSMNAVDHGVLVRVVDDGVGLAQPVERLAGRDHFGLLEMRERAETAGGWWSVSGRQGEGTTVMFWVPALMYGEGGVS